MMVVTAYTYAGSVYISSRITVTIISDKQVLE